MSAFVVSKKHIDQLVAVAQVGPSDCNRRDWFPPNVLAPSGRTQAHQLHPDDLGQILLDENLRSVHARYPDTVTDPNTTPGPTDRYWSQPYCYDSPVPRLTAIQALKALACYEYQSCECDDWLDSPVRQFCEDFRSSLIRVLPGYDQADWSID